MITQDQIPKQADEIKAHKQESRDFHFREEWGALAGAGRSRDFSLTRKGLRQVKVPSQFHRGKDFCIYELGQINVREEVGTALSRFKQQAEKWKGWTEKKLTPNGYSKVLESMKLGVKAKDQIWRRMIQEAEGHDRTGFPILTVWAFYDILTYHITHNAVSLNHQVELQGRLRVATAHWMG